MVRPPSATPSTVLERRFLVGHCEAGGTLVRRAVALLARAVAVAVADRVGREPVLVCRLPFLYQVAAYGYG